MFRKMKPSIGNYYKLPNPGLWAYFKHVTSGQPEDYRSPFWNKMERSKVLQLWQNELDATDLKETLPELYAYELDMKSNVGPMSIQKPLQDVLEDIENYYTMVDTPSVPISSEAVKATIRFFSKAGGVRIKDHENVIADMRLNTNSGSWLFIKRRRAVPETNEVLYTLNGQRYWFDNKFGLHVLVKDGNGYKEYELVATKGWRGQEGGIEPDDVKQRVVWMMPFLLNIIELQMYQPLIKAIQKNDLIPAYISMDRVDQEVTALFDTKRKRDLVICTDFSKFDQHFNRDMQIAALHIIKSLINKGSWTELDDDIFYAKFNIPLVCNEEVMYTGPHGMGSGSGGTNFDECMAHKALQFEAALDNHAHLNPHSMAYGDDGILTYPGITVDQVIQAYTKHGQEMNVTKQYASTHDCVVLRRWHGMKYRVNGTMVGVYSTFRALGRLLAQERFYDPDKWNANMVTLRALSILENCKWHPYFHKFIDFVIKGDKYELGLKIPGFFDDLEHLAKEAIESFTDFLGYTKTLQEPNAADGINNWEVVKYLKSKLR